MSSHLLASVQNHTFTECFDEERDPFFWRLTDMSTRIAGGRYRLDSQQKLRMKLDAADPAARFKAAERLLDDLGGP